MTPSTDSYVEMDGHRFLRVPVHARFRPAEADEVPTPTVLAEKSVAASKKKYYWQDAENPDLVWVNFILDSEGANLNRDYMPRSQLLASYHTAKYKPHDMEHIIREDDSMVYMDKRNPPVKNTICGVITHTALADWKGNLLTDKQIAALDKSDDPDREDKDKVCVVAWCALYYFLFPQTISHLVQTLASGGMKVSMERWIKSWDFLYRDGKNYRAVSHQKAVENGLFDKWQEHKTINGQPILRRTLGYTYGGVASTTNPANGLSRYVSQKNLPKRASASLERDPVIEILRARHDECVAAYAGSHSDAEKSELNREHIEIHQAMAKYLGD